MTTQAGAKWLDLDYTLEIALESGDSELVNAATVDLQRRNDLTLMELAVLVFDEHPLVLKGIKSLWTDPNYKLTPLDKALIRMTLNGEQETT